MLTEYSPLSNEVDRLIGGDGIFSEGGSLGLPWQQLGSRGQPCRRCTRMLKLSKRREKACKDHSLVRQAGRQAGRQVGR